MHHKYTVNATVPGLAGVLEGDAMCELLKPDTIGKTSDHKELIVCAVNIIAFDENKEATFTPRYSAVLKKKKIWYEQVTEDQNVVTVSNQFDRIVFMKERRKNFQELKIMLWKIECYARNGWRATSWPGCYLLASPEGVKKQMQFVYTQDE
jgi:hypothetical protein